MAKNKYARYFQRGSTPQTEEASVKQSKNHAGGYSFVVSDWERLERFLILGSEGGTYYVGGRQLTRKNAQTVDSLLKKDGAKVVEKIVEISRNGRAPKNDPAIFSLAMAASVEGDNPQAAQTRAKALGALPAVCRTGTHLFQFADCVDGMRGWGRGLRGAIAKWYVGRSAKDLAYQAVKYQSRGGWSHRDLLRLSHPSADTEVRNAIFRYITKGEFVSADALAGAPADEALAILWGVESAKRAKTAKEVVTLIKDFGLVRECIPSRFLRDPLVWEALLEKMPVHAVVRNLGNMSRCGLLTAGSDASRKVVSMLGDRERLLRARMHPFSLLMAQCAYSGGKGIRSNKEWATVPKIVDALDDAFYASFHDVVPSGKRFTIGLDVSSSMDVSMLAGSPMSARQAACALAMVIMRTEPECEIMAFSHSLVHFPISAKQRLDDVIRAAARIPFGGTDVSLPIRWALENKVETDTFMILTDNETWAGPEHTHESLVKYRRQMGIPAKMVVVGMTATEVTVADPDDAGMLDVVGFDTATPSVISDFAKGNVEEERKAGA